VAQLWQGLVDLAVMRLYDRGGRPELEHQPSNNGMELTRSALATRTAALAAHPGCYPGT
jgi:hypothetical protein